MKTTETSTSLLPPCLLLNLALIAALFLQPLPYAQVNTQTHGLNTLLFSLPPSHSLVWLNPLPSPGSGECLEHGYVLNSRYQVVYPFPTFQPAFQLKKDQVILLNTSYSLVACGISLCPGELRTQMAVLANFLCLKSYVRLFFLHIGCTTHLQWGTFDWLWNNLDVLLMFFYDLHKRTRPSMRKSAISTIYSWCLSSVLPGRMKSCRFARNSKAQTPAEPWDGPRVGFADTLLEAEASLPQARSRALPRCSTRPHKDQNRRHAAGGRWREGEHKRTRTKSQ